MVDARVLPRHGGIGVLGLVGSGGRTVMPVGSTVGLREPKVVACDLTTTRRRTGGRKGRSNVNTRELLDRIAENVSVRRSFGAAYEREGVLIIPVAFVVGGGGGGEGPVKPQATGHSRAIETAEPANGASQQPTGTGGGFGGLVMPMGVYVVKGDQVRWVPAFDTTLIALASLSVMRVLVGLLKNGRRRNRA
jgi:uncharacterized spore protein YtfJ